MARGKRVSTGGRKSTSRPRISAAERRARRDQLEGERLERAEAERRRVAAAKAARTRKRKAKTFGGHRVKAKAIEQLHAIGRVLGATKVTIVDSDQGKPDMFALWGSSAIYEMPAGFRHSDLSTAMRRIEQSRAIERGIDPQRKARITTSFSRRGKEEWWTPSGPTTSWEAAVTRTRAATDPDSSTSKIRWSPSTPGADKEIERVEIYLSDDEQSFGEVPF